MNNLIKELTSSELEKVVDYFYALTPEDAERMQVNRQALPARDQWAQMLQADLKKPLSKRQYCYVGWLHDGELIGHCGINNIKYGKETCIHLHLWLPTLRRKGLGLDYFLESIRFYFEKFELGKIICEPNTANRAPNKCLIKAGFEFIDSYRTKPSALNFEHQVSRYEMIRKS